MDEKTIHLKGEQSITFQITDDKEKGTFKGVAYSGKPVKNHGGYVNMIIDLESMEFKEEIPVLRDHEMSKYIGKARLYKEDDQLKVEGKLFSKSQLGKEVRDLAEDGANWELSVGLGFGELESYGENEEVEVNGFIQKGPTNVIRSPRVSEVSFVAIGADTSAFAEVFNLKKEEIKIMENKKEKLEIEKVEFTQEEWEAFACACGGSKESKLSEVEQKLKDEKEEMQKQIDELKKELKKYKELEKKKELSQKLDEKGLELTDEKIETLINNEEKFNSYLEFLDDMPKKEDKKIDAKFTQVITPEPQVDSKEKQRLAAEMVKKGEAKNIIEALKRV